MGVASSNISRCEPSSPPSDNGELPELVRQAQAAEEEEAGLKNPGQFDDLEGAPRRVLGIDTFDGFRFQFMRPLSQNFMLTHTMMFGNTLQLGDSVPGGTLYQFAAHAVKGEGNVLVGIVDLNGVVRGELRKALGASGNFRMSGQFCEERERNHLSMDYDHVAKDFSVNLKCENGQVLGSSFVHAVTPTIAVGAAMFHFVGQGKSVINYGARYANKEWSFVAKQGMRGYDAWYHRKVNDRVSLACGYTFNPATLESMTNFGAEFNLKQSQFQAHVDATGKISSSLVAMPMMGIRMNLSAEMHHATDHYKFGYGLSVGQ
jgi:hypothetical protein